MHLILLKKSPNCIFNNPINFILKILNPIQINTFNKTKIISKIKLISSLLLIQFIKLKNHNSVNSNLKYNYLIHKYLHNIKNLYLFLVFQRQAKL
jgi:hypothetical protein